MSRLKTDAIRNVNASVDGITLDTSGNVAIPNELQLADKIVHTGDTNTFIRFPAADTVSVETAGSERLRITSDGAFGFGDTAPVPFSGYTNVSIHGSSGGAITFGDDGTDEWEIYGGDGSIRIYDRANTTERLRIKSDGKIGIGTSSPTNNVHLSKVNAGGDVSLRITNATNQNSGSTASLYFTTSPTVDFNTAYIQAVRDGGKLNFGYHSQSPTVCMRISTGNVGIGTTDPSQKLEVNGLIKITGSGGQGVNIENSGGTNAACINLKNTLTNYVKEYRVAVAGSDGAYATASSLFVRDQTSNATRLELGTSGDFKVSSGDIFFGTAGKGIVLGATSNTDANTLEDYEEGTWTPTTVTGTWGLVSGYYTKIGRQVHVNAYMYGCNTTTGSNPVRVNNLPFAPGWGQEGGTLQSQGCNAFSGVYINGTPYAAFYQNDGSASTHYMEHQDISAGGSTGTLHWQATYFTN